MLLKTCLTMIFITSTLSVSLYGASQGNNITLSANGPTSAIAVDSDVYEDSSLPESSASFSESLGETVADTRRATVSRVEAGNKFVRASNSYARAGNNAVRAAGKTERVAARTGALSVGTQVLSGQVRRGGAILRREKKNLRGVSHAMKRRERNVARKVRRKGRRVDRAVNQRMRRAHRRMHRRINEINYWPHGGYGYYHNHYYGHPYRNGYGLGNASAYSYSDPYGNRVYSSSQSFSTNKGGYIFGNNNGSTINVSTPMGGGSVLIGAERN